MPVVPATADARPRKQRTIDYTRSEQLSLRMRIELPPGEKFLLWILDDHIGPHRSWTLTFEQLANESGYSVRSVRNYIEALVARGFVWFEKPTGRYHEQRMEFFITWANIEEALEPPSAEMAGGPAPEPPPPPPVASGSPCNNPAAGASIVQELQQSCTTCTNPADSARSLIRKTAPSDCPSLLPISTAPVLPEVALDRGKVMEMVRTAGLTGLFAEAVDAALANGMSLPQIATVVEHFRAHPGRWKPGVLYSRLTKAGAASQPPEEGWFGETPGWKSKQATGAKPALSDHEIRWGPRFDALDGDELLELADQAPVRDRNFLLSAIGFRKLSGQWNSAAREQLLELFVRSQSTARKHPHETC